LGRGEGKLKILSGGKNRMKKKNALHKKMSCLVLDTRPKGKKDGKRNLKHDYIFGLNIFFL
jgi:hypothetical protein